MDTTLLKQTTLFLLIATLVGLAALQPDREARVAYPDSVNAVIGDRSFTERFGHEPGQETPEQLRIVTHLRYVERMLREAPTGHLTETQRRNRARYLDLLAEYRRTGEFPHNDGHPDPRRPTFIDRGGNICAVGYLVEQSAGRAAAEAIAGDYKYAYISQIDDPRFNRWMEQSGFTRRELGMIQPAYNPPPQQGPRKVNQNEVKPGYGLASGILWSANVIYYTNAASNPWLFPSAKSAHWSGLLTGAGTAAIGVFNLDNREPEDRFCAISAVWGGGSCRDVVYTNHARTALSAVNIGIGAYSMGRAAYHLLFKNEWEVPARKKGADVGVSRIQAGPLADYHTAPALRLNVRF